MPDWIIIVDDDTVNLKMAGTTLSRHGMRVTAIKTGEAFLKFIRENGTPDIILLDIRMPGMDGFETLIHLREIEKELGYKETPVIFLTADEDKSHEIRGFQMGVSDFIHKPFDPDVLVQRISSIVHRDRELHIVEEKATHDLLTGFYNKESVKEEISGLIAKEAGAFCMIDLDAFKLVNDIYGHEMGDRMLSTFADIVRDNITDGSVAGRIGGDEFVLFGVNMQRESDVAEFTETLNLEIRKAALHLMGDEVQIPLGASVGAVQVPGHGTDYEELFNKADKALLMVKNNGKHGYSVYSEQHPEGFLEEGANVDLKTLSKLLEERNIRQSVMWVGREAFGNVYRYMVRYLDRYGISAYKILFTLKYGSDDIPADVKERASASLRELIQMSLRNSDIMVRVGRDQFFLLLPELRIEHVDRVVGRIIEGWKKTEQGPLVELEYEYDHISSVNENPGSGSRAENVSDRIVVVDDDRANLMVAKAILEKEGMTVTCLKSGRELIDHLQGNDEDLILLDIKMPEMDGFETIHRIHSKGGAMSRTPVIFLTANQDDKTESQGFAMGAVDFIRKPFVPEILVVRVRHAINMIRMQNHLRSVVNEKTEENEKLSIHIIQALATAIDAKDCYTSGHSDRVANYARMIAAGHGYDGKDQDKVYMMGLLHDVGKIGIPDEIINKPGTLTKDEYEVIKSHPVEGERILNTISEMPDLATGARWHHERYDGKGYPDGIGGEDIPEEARIIAVADSYDAMTSRRSYRDALPQEKVRDELVKGKGTQFDPIFVDIMLGLMDADKNYDMREK